MTGEPFRARQEDRFVIIEAVNDPEFSVSLSLPTYGAHRGRLEISGRYNGLTKFLPYKHERHEITVALDTPPAKIAAAIVKRLWPGYAGEIVKAKAARAEYEQAVEQASRVAKILTGAARMRVSSNHASDTTIVLYDQWRTISGANAEAEVQAYSQETTVSLKLRGLTVEQARAILARLSAEAAEGGDA